MLVLVCRIQRFAAAQVQVERLRVAGRAAGQRHLLGRRQLERQGVDDLARHRFLDVEHVGHLALVAVGPQLRARRDVDEVRRDAQVVLVTPDRALDDVARAQFVADLVDVELRALVADGVRPRHDRHALEPRQVRDQVLGQPVAEVVALLVRADVDERQHGNDLVVERLALGARGDRRRHRRGAGLHPEPRQRAHHRRHVLLRPGSEQVDVLDAGERIAQRDGHFDRLEVHRQDVLLAIQCQRDFLDHVGRFRGGRGQRQQQHLAPVDRLDDLRRPQRCRVDAALVDPDRDALAAQLLGDGEDAVAILRGIADADFVGHELWGGHRRKSRRVRIMPFQAVGGKAPAGARTDIPRPGPVGWATMPWSTQE